MLATSRGINDESMGGCVGVKEEHVELCVCL
jgi:hypothetical protein